jgi:hypothetical protein
MMWLTWRQHRAQVLATAAFLLVAGVYLVVSGEAAYPALSLLLPLAPILVGIFWGAPVLAREAERGTHRLAWTQSVSRGRWLTTKLGALGLAVTAAGLALGLMVTLWVDAFDADRFGDAALFSGTGVVSGAWWLFAFLLGTAAGAVVRRVLPALAITIALFMVTLFMMFQAREAYAEPVRMSPEAQPPAHSLITGSTFVSTSGSEVAEPPECAAESRDTYINCVDDAGYRSVLFVQPADRYWRYQWTETAILLLCTVLLAAPVTDRVLRRPI